MFGAAGRSPKVQALQANPAVAIRIDSESPPYRLLMVRGSAHIEFVEGAVDEYADAALRYYGAERGAQYRDYAKAKLTGMARITVTPEWVGLIDFETRFPQYQ